MDDLERRVVACVDSNETVRLLQAMVRADSALPAADCRAVCAVAIKALEAAGVACRVLCLEPSSPNLIARMGGGNGPTLAFTAHMDTVPVGDVSSWTHKPMAADVVDGKLYGRGAGDCKGSVAAMVSAGVALARAEAPLKGTLLINLASDEESGGRKGVGWLREQGHLRPDFLVVGEQTANCVALGERTPGRIEITVRGRAAHGATPWYGHNAIVTMARLLTFVDDRLQPALARRQHQYLPRSAYNVGIIEGGQRPNIVPDICRARIDRRLLPDESPEAAMAEMRALLEEFARAVEPIDFELNGRFAPVALYTAPDSPLVLQAQKAAQDVGAPGTLVGYTMSSDGHHFGGDGIPVVIFGPGDPSLAHATDEYVEVEEVITAAQAYALLAVRMLSEGAN